jgi:hypothetical protein
MAADDERCGPRADPRTLALSDGVFAIAMTLLIGAWALLIWLLLAVPRRAGGTTVASWSRRR